MSRKKLALLAGGISAEREVSEKTGKAIYEALDKNKYKVTYYDPKNDLPSLVEDITADSIQMVIPALHGPFGEDGKMQGMLDMLQVPYLFSGCTSSALAMNKEWAKRIVSEENITVIKDKKLKKEEDTKQKMKELSLPVVIKPIELGSSVGISVAKEEAEVEEGVKEAFHHDDTILVEEYVKGRELTVTVMGRKDPQALPVIEIKPKKSEWFDFQAKYEPGATEEICPAQIPTQLKDRIQEQALKAFNTLGCRDVARVDFIWNEQNDYLYFLEINTIPGMTSTSLVPQAARAHGIEFDQFLDNLIKGALE